VTIEADAAFRHLQVFTPFDCDFFCAEPVSHVPDAINRSDLPPGQAMHVLPPGESLAGSVTIALSLL
jgi:aldose 1-epimerase